MSFASTPFSVKYRRRPRLNVWNPAGSQGPLLAHLGQQHSGSDFFPFNLDSDRGRAAQRLITPRR